MRIYIFLFLVKGGRGDWVSEWLSPLEHQYKDILIQNTNSTLKSFPEDNDSGRIHINRYIPMDAVEVDEKSIEHSNDKLPSNNLKTKLEEALRTAQSLTAMLKKEIMDIENQERLLKEAIANGRFGVTTVTVSTLEQAPRSYIIRDGFWTLCNGIIQYPPNKSSYNNFKEFFSSPRCIGLEITSKRDPCIFNSIIKYETIPSVRGPTYVEENYVCLKPSFNNTLENYQSVPKAIIEGTCNKGVVKSLTDNQLDCGLRVISEYTFYPHKDQITNPLPLDYCTEKDGACKLIVAWHLSNKTIENFEFLKSDNDFKKFFLKSATNIEPFE